MFPLTVTVLTTEASLQEEVALGGGLLLLAVAPADDNVERRIMPLLELLSDEYRGKLRFALADARLIPAAAASFGLATLPGFVLYRDGEVVERSVGAAPRQILKVMINKHV